MNCLPCTDYVELYFTNYFFSIFTNTDPGKLLRTELFDTCASLKIHTRSLTRIISCLSSNERDAKAAANKKTQSKEPMIKR